MCAYHVIVIIFTLHFFSNRDYDELLKIEGEALKCILLLLSLILTTTLC